MKVKQFHEKDELCQIDQVSICPLVQSLTEEREGVELHNTTNKTRNIVANATKRITTFQFIRQKFLSCDKKEVLNMMAEADMESPIPSIMSPSITKNPVPKMRIESPIIGTSCERDAFTPFTPDTSKPTTFHDLGQWLHSSSSLSEDDESYLRTSLSINASNTDTGNNEDPNYEFGATGDISSVLVTN